MVSFAFLYIVCIGIVVVWVCVFSNLCAFMQVRSTEVEVSSVRWRIFAGMTIRHGVVFFYMICMFCLCFAFAVPASGELQQTSEGPEFGAGPENFNKAQVNAICTLCQVSVLCLQVNKKNRSPLAVLLQGTAGRHLFTASNLFRQAENCYRFSDNPPPMSQRQFSILQCLLSHCCRQFFFFLFLGRLVL